MKEKIIRFFKMWTLPLGMFAGVGVYLMFHYISGRLYPAGDGVYPIIYYLKAGGQTLQRLYQLRAGLRAKEHDTCHLGILYLPYSRHLRGAQLLYRLAEYRELLATVAERETGCAAALIWMYLD